jgi:hypothetical protein
MPSPQACYGSGSVVLRIKNMDAQPGVTLNVSHWTNLHWNIVVSLQPRPAEIPCVWFLDLLITQNVPEADFVV